MDAVLSSARNGSGEEEWDYRSGRGRKLGDQSVKEV